MQFDKFICLLATGMACAFSSGAAAMTDAESAQITEQRLLGDQTKACFAVAVIDTSVSRVFVCADPRDKNRISPNSAFEIGSVSKTMLAALWAEQIEQGKASLHDPIAQYLPAGMQVPSFENQPILLKNLMTHTSGLPVVPDFWSALDPSNPYALIDADSVLATLSQSTLNRAPGSKFEYSNFAMMLATLMLTRQTNTDFETLLQTRLLGPLGMASSYVNARPAGVTAAQGHLPNTQAAPAWTFQTDSAGVGGVRATLDDMTRFVQAQLGKPPSSMTAALQLSQQAIKTPAIRTIGMNWMRSAPFQQTIVSHEGGTGGFSAYVAFNTEASRGVVVLSDTALTSLSGFTPKQPDKTSLKWATTVPATFIHWLLMHC